MVSLIGCQVKKQEYYVLTQDIQEQIKAYIENQEQMRFDAYIGANSSERVPIVDIEDNAISVHLSNESYHNFLMYQKSEKEYYYYYFTYEEEQLFTQNEAYDDLFTIRISQVYTNDEELASYHVPFKADVSLYEVGTYHEESSECQYVLETDSFDCGEKFEGYEYVNQVALEYYHDIQSKSMSKEKIEEIVADLATIIETSTEKTTDKPGDYYYTDEEVYKYAVLEKNDFEKLAKSDNLVTYDLEFMSAGGYLPYAVENKRKYFLTFYYNEEGVLSTEHYFIDVEWKEKADNVGPSIILETYPVIYDEATNTANIRCEDRKGNKLSCNYVLLKENDTIGTLQIFTTDEAGYTNSLSIEIELRNEEEFLNLKSGVYYDNKEKITYYVTSEGFVCTKYGMEFALVKDTGNRYDLQYIHDDGPTDTWYIEEDSRIKYCDWNQDCRYLEKVGELNEME